MENSRNLDLSPQKEVGRSSQWGVGYMGQWMHFLESGVLVKTPGRHSSSYADRLTGIRRAQLTVHEEGQREEKEWPSICRDEESVLIPNLMERFLILP